MSRIWLRACGQTSRLKRNSQSVWSWLGSTLIILHYQRTKHKKLNQAAELSFREIWCQMHIGSKSSRSSSDWSQSMFCVVCHHVPFECISFLLGYGNHVLGKVVISCRRTTWWQKLHYHSLVYRLLDCSHPPQIQNAFSGWCDFVCIRDRSKIIYVISHAVIF